MKVLIAANVLFPTVMREVGREAAVRGFRTRTGSEVMRTYFAASVEELSDAYGRYVDALVANGTRDRLVSDTEWSGPEI